MAAQRANAKKEGGDGKPIMLDGLDNKAFMTECGVRWKAIDEKSKLEFEVLAAEDKERYNKECKEVRRPPSRADLGGLEINADHMYCPRQAGIETADEKKAKKEAEKSDEKAAKATELEAKKAVRKAAQEAENEGKAAKRAQEKVRQLCTIARLLPAI